MKGQTATQIWRKIQDSAFICWIDCFCAYDNFNDEDVNKFIDIVNEMIDRKWVD